MFSPYYAWSGRGDPLNHCAINVALYGRRHHRWMMTEHGRAHVTRTPDIFRVGASALTWCGDALEISIDERCAPIPLPGRGRIRVHPHFAPGATVSLDTERRHWWTPIAPRCTVEVAFAQPALTWRGAGYCDSNVGDEPLERGFRHWDWARAHHGDGCLVAYRTTPRRGSALDVSLHIDAHGEIAQRSLPTLQRLPSTVWGIARATRADTARVERTLEDAPFYARSKLDATVYGARGPMMHESLNLERFSHAWVKALLPVRMPRRV